MGNKPYNTHTHTDSPKYNIYSTPKMHIPNTLQQNYKISEITPGAKTQPQPNYKAASRDPTSFGKGSKTVTVW